jgi:hypothetical protein
MPAILTNITSNQLGCTLHCREYHCLLRLRSNRHDGVSAGAASSSASAACSANRDNLMSTPDITTLSVIPIRADDDNGAVSDHSILDDDEIPLLPESFSCTHATNGINPTINAKGNNNQHKCKELIRITTKLEIQLKERLKDASDGAVFSPNNADKQQVEYEEFLRRSDAIFSELLSAVHQQIRKEQSSFNGSGKGKKRTRTQQHNGSNSTLVATSTPPLEYYSSLLRQLQIIQNMSNVTDISLHKQSTSSNNDNTNVPADLSRVSVTCIDKHERSHTWHAELYPTVVMTMDLPAEFALDDKRIRMDRWWEDGGDASRSLLLKIQHQFQLVLDKYQPLFNELDDLDSHLWVLEPSLPARRCSVERRIALWEGGASMVIVLDPENPRGVPVMVRFLGVSVATMTAAANARRGENGGEIVDWRTSFAEFVSEEVEEKAKAGRKQPDIGVNQEEKTGNQNNKHWSEERNIRENLELWFGSPLPSPLSSEKSDYLVECGICYTHRLPIEDETDPTAEPEEGPLPEAKCNNVSCNRHYHDTCLFEWLHSLPTARVSFDRIFGSCPYCCEAVSVKILNGSKSR